MSQTGMQQGVLDEVQSLAPFNNPQSRAQVPMQNLWTEIRSRLVPKRPLQCTHWPETLQMQISRLQCWIQPSRKTLDPSPAALEQDFPP